MNETSITISKEKVQREKGVVILSLKEYQKLLERAIPTYQLMGGATKKLDKLVAKAIREHKAGRTKELKSLADLEL